jgi:UDP-N-acetylglucosamine 2-epimerase (non-hydrolysing)
MKPLIVIGTRPEAIKLAPVARALPEARVVLTGQHGGALMNPVLTHFGVTPCIVGLHRPGETLANSAARLQFFINAQTVNASCVIAQGDTTTAAMAAVSAFYHKIPFVHVEAGLRTYREIPYPEEFNRRVCALAARIHCAPTRRAAENLAAEKVPGRIEVTGNTIVDALEYTRATIGDDPTVPHVLVTCHRRENFGEAFENVCNAVCQIAHDHSEVRVIWAVHPNPNARPRAMPGVELIDPPAYPEWVRMMATADLILTDSGGIQEEAAILGKRCLVMRDLTERPEAVECGACRMVGTETQAIIEAASDALNGVEWSMKPHPFGDGKAAERIAELVRGL